MPAATRAKPSAARPIWAAGSPRWRALPASRAAWAPSGSSLTLATGLASGDPLSSTLGGLQTGSLVSGALGGPTISSGLSALYPLLQSIGPAAAEGIGAAGAGAGAGVGAGIMGGGLGASMAGMAALAPIALFLMGELHSAFGGGGDMFDAMFGNVKTPAQKQYEEFKKASDEFPGLAQRRVAGADLFSHLGDYDTPDEVTSGLQIASSGRSAEPESAAFNLQHPGSAIFPKVQPVNLDAWNAAAPGLAGKNWGSFLNLMDRGRGWDSIRGHDRRLEDRRGERRGHLQARLESDGRGLPHAPRDDLRADHGARQRR